MVDTREVPDHLAMILILAIFIAVLGILNWGVLISLSLKTFDSYKREDTISKK